MADAPPEAVASWARGHWAIENRLHWIRDVVTGEDRHQLRTRNAPFDLLISAALRNLTIWIVLGAGMILILPWIQTLHHTQDDPNRHPCPETSQGPAGGGSAVAQVVQICYKGSDHAEMLKENR